MTKLNEFSTFVKISHPKITNNLTFFETGHVTTNKETCSCEERTTTDPVVLKEKKPLRGTHHNRRCIFEKTTISNDSIE